MADITKTIQIIFAGDDQISETVRGINSKMNDFETVVSSAVGPLASLADGVLETDAILAAMAAGSLVAATAAAEDFQSGLSEISTLVTATDEDLDKFNQQILDYATGSTKSIDDINASIYTAISAGVDYDKSLDLLNTSEKLSVAGRADLEDTTRLLVSTLNAYGEGTDQATHYSDIMFTTVKDGQTTITELADDLAKVTGIASSAGVPFETLSAALAATTAAGLPTSEAVTGLKAALTNIISPTSEATKYADELGINFNATALETDGFQNMLWKAYEATGGNIESMGKLFGSTEALNTVMVLAADESGEFAKALTDMGDSTGATETAYNKMVDTLDNQTQKLKNSVNVVLIEIGDELLPGVTDSAGSLSDVFAGIKVALDEGAFDPVFAALDEFLKSFSDYMGGVADALPEALGGVDWQPMLDAIDEVGGEIEDAFNAIFGDLDLTDPDDLEQLIQKLVDGIENLAHVTVGIIDSWTPFLEGLGKAYDEFTKLSPEAATSTGEITGFAQAIETIMNAAGEFISAIGTIATSLTVIAGTSAASAIGSLGQAVVNSSSTLKTFGEILGTAIGSASTGQMLGVLGLGAAAGYAAGEIIDQYVPGVHQATEAMVDWIDRMIDFTGTQGAQNEAVEEGAYQAEMANDRLGAMADTLSDLSTKQQLEFMIEADDANLTMDQVAARFEELTKDQQTKFLALVDEGSYDDALRMLDTVPSQKDIDITATGTDDLSRQLQDLGLQVAGIPDEKFVAIMTTMDSQAYQDLEKALAAIPTEKRVDFMTNAAAIESDVQDLMYEIGELPPEKQTLIIAAISQGDVDKAKAILDGTFPEEKVTTGKPEVDKAAADKAQKELEELFLKEYQIEAEIEIANIEAETAKVEAAFDAMTDISVASVEADAARIEAAYASIGSTVETTTDLVGDLVDALVGTDDPNQQWYIQNLIEEQIEMEKEALAQQQELTEAQVAYMNAKAAAMESGESLITIQADGLEPEIEAFMWKILEKIQLRAAEEQAEFLLGMPGAEATA